eukprot:Skav229638  [mRNA]  locus=scaffold649:276506:280753:+ [translate_table: standard]
MAALVEMGPQVINPGLSKAPLCWDDATTYGQHGKHRPARAASQLSRRRLHEQLLSGQGRVVNRDIVDSGAGPGRVTGSSASLARTCPSIKAQLASSPVVGSWAQADGELPMSSPFCQIKLITTPPREALGQAPHTGDPWGTAPGAKPWADSALRRIAAENSKAWLPWRGTCQWWLTGGASRTVNVAPKMSS